MPPGVLRTTPNCGRGRTRSPRRSHRVPASQVGDFAVRVASGSLGAQLRADTRLPHRWTEEGVSIEAQFTGARLLHLAAAGCVLNGVYRGAAEAGIRLDGVLVNADGEFEADTWR